MNAAYRTASSTASETRKMCRSYAVPLPCTRSATFGRCATKKQTIYGYRLHLLITLGGAIVDFELTSANADDRDAARDMLPAHPGLTVIGDKGYISAPLAEELWEQCRIRLLTLPRANQQTQLPPEVRRLINQVRQIIETVNDQL